MGTGCVSRIAICLCLGFPSWKGSRKAWWLVKSMKISDCGSLLTPLTNSQSVFSSQESKSLMNLPRASRPTSKAPTTSSKKKNMSPVPKTLNSVNCCSRWHFSMQLSWKERSSVQLGGTQPTSGWTVTSRHATCSWRSTLKNRKKCPTAASTTFLQKWTTGAEWLTTKTPGWSSPFCLGTSTLRSWKPNTTNSQKVTFTSPQKTFLYLLSKNTLLTSLSKTSLKYLGCIRMPILSTSRMWPITSWTLSLKSSREALVLGPLEWVLTK